MRLSYDAMVAALNDFRQLQYSKQLVSLYESFLVGHWLHSHGHYPSPVIKQANEAVAEIFVLFPDHPRGRLYPFRFDWLVREGSGRRTVWNNTTRGEKLATKIYRPGSSGHGDIRQGLVPNAGAILQNELIDCPLPSWQSLVCLVLSQHDFGASDNWTSARQIMLNELGFSSSDLSNIADNRTLGPALLGAPEWPNQSLPSHLAPPTSATPSIPTSVATQGSADRANLPVVVDARVKRMLEQAIISHRCLLLVGPPGSGKGTLVRWLVDQVTDDPVRFGFSVDLEPNPVWRTPDESWSSLELVGGLLPSANGELEWSNGLVVNAIAENRWLVLDETNRADMDKIMGPLLTWLSEQEVEVGQSRPHHGTVVSLGWANSNESMADDPEGVGQSTRFLAGRDWRLLGTYNPQDAQRVFRFGQALTRRFAVVPVPAILPSQFEQLLPNVFPTLHTDAAGMVANFYSQHYEDATTVLGPAVFLRMANYIVNADSSTDLQETIAEAYVISVGKFLSNYDDQAFDGLGIRIQEASGLSVDHWTWIASQRNLLS